MGTLPLLFLITEEALSLSGVTIILLYITVPKSGAQNFKEPGVLCNNKYYKVRGKYNSGIIIE